VLDEFVRDFVVARHALVLHFLADHEAEMTKALVGLGGRRATLGGRAFGWGRGNGEGWSLAGELSGKTSHIAGI
jgi:hypothetical protein